MPLIPMCRAECEDCGKEFSYPTLSDFSYGEFILHRDDGRDFRYLRAIENDVWEFVAAHVGKNSLQEMVARIVDAPRGRTFTMKMVCPNCGSQRFRDWAGEQLSTSDLPEATFENFCALGQDAKLELLKKLEQSISEDHPPK